MSWERTRKVTWVGLLLPGLLLAAESPWVQDVRSARTAINRGDFALAESFLDMALRAAREEKAVDGRLAGAYEALGERWQQKGVPGEAARVFETAIAVWKEVAGEDQPRVASVVSRLAEIKENAGRYEEAEALRLETIRILENHFGPDSPNIVGAVEKLARYYEQQSRMTDAESQYKRALDILIRAFGTGSPLAMPTLRAYIDLLKKASRPGEAVELESLLRELNPPVFQIRDGVKPPRLESRREPGYSEEARAKHIEAIVVMTMVVDDHGVPAAILVKEPVGFGLDEKAVEAVSAWRFRPGLKDGRPVSVLATVEMNFRLL